MDIPSIIQSISQRVREVGDAGFAVYNEFARPLLDVLHIVFNNLFYFFLFLLGFLSLLYFLSMVYVTFRKKEPYEERPLDPDQLPFVSVHIPTRNELAALQCAEKCLQFDYPSEKYEILIGDDSNDAAASREIAAFAENHDRVIVHKREENAGYKAGNLNNLLKHTKGEYVVLFDSDFLPKPDFLRRIIAPMVHDDNIGGVQSRWSYTNTERNFVSVLGAGIGGVFHYIALPFFNKRRRLSVLCGSAEAVRKSTLEKLGGWEHGSLTEDIEYSLRLLKNGYRIQYLPNLTCDSEVPFTPRDLYRQQMRWSYGVIYSLKEHFKQLYTSSKLTLQDKLLISYVFSGYLLTMSLALVIIFGVLSIVTHEPQPILWGQFFYETVRNILVTSGLIAAALYSLYRMGHLKLAPKMLAASFSIGLVVTYYVNVGILRVLTGRSMPWFLLNKQGNSYSNKENSQISVPSDA